MSKQQKIQDLLEGFYNLSIEDLTKSFISSDDLRTKVEFICRCNANKAPIRFILSCLLGKIDKPNVDIRKPYTEIKGEGTFSGRFYDETFIEEFVYKHKLPCNSTTAYLTPAFRNIDRVLTPDLVLVGRPREAYNATLEILDSVYCEREEAENIFIEIIRFLLIIKTEYELRMHQLISNLKQSDDFLPLSSEDILTLLTQHLNCRYSSRLPVLIIAAAYQSVKDKIGEINLPLQGHNAADRQTGSLGDVEITLINDDKIIMSYEMKDKRVTKNDIEHCLQKLLSAKSKIDNYIFITTDIIDSEVTDFAKSLYEKTGIEIAVLDCIGFLRHYLHFFHRQRNIFLNTYQELVLSEPSSSVSQVLKEAFLALRSVTESDRH